jgi:predicted dehydrogenase
VLRAATAGRQIICEKPLARYAEQAREMAGACASAGVRLLPAHVVRYFPAYAAAHAAVAGGRIGTPAILRFTRRGSVPTWSAWYRDEQRSGGLLMDFMIHDYDIARWLAGEVRRVYARLAATGDAGGVTGLVVLTHAGGAISHVHGAWVPEMGFLATGFELSGDRGVLSSPAGPALAAGPGGTAGRGQFATGQASPFAAELTEFLATIENGSEPRVSAADGVAAVVIAEAAIESARTGAAISLDGGTR